MASIVNEIVNDYNYVFVELADPRVESYFLMSSPFPLLGIVICYHYFIFKLGPELMKNRPPFNIDWILMIYNLIQVIMCGNLVVQSVRHMIFRYNLFCEPIDYSNDEYAVLATEYAWIYLMLKIADLLDTVFFVLRKKHNQVTFLHVYHHTGMCWLGWLGVKYIAGGHGMYVGFINSIVHTVMYAYYFLTAWDKEYKKNIWWKKYITQLQIAQFVLLSLHFSQLLFQPNCKYPKWTVYAFVPQNVLMIVLFTNFYIKTYVKPQQKHNKECPNNSVSNVIQQDLVSKKEH